MWGAGRSSWLGEAPRMAYRVSVLGNQVVVLPLILDMKSECGFQKPGGSVFPRVPPMALLSVRALLNYIFLHSRAK